jgi:amino acid adenylation domain-containing protein
LMERLPMGGVDVVVMDGAGTDPGWLEEVGEWKEEKVRVKGENLAYILYTSGSTGRPKGVMVEHRGLSNYLAHAAETYLNEEIEGSVVSTPLSFDATLTTLLTPLVMGKVVELLPEDGRTMERLAERMFGGEAGRLFKITPAHLEGLEYVSRPQEVGRAKHMVVVGGEQLGAQRLVRWKREILPEARFVNEYGPTEAVVGCSVWMLSEESGLEELEGRAAAPIGRPIGNTQLYVMGEGGQLQPKKCVGELYIGGEGLARGYLNGMGMTAEKFLPNPLGKRGGERLYRTGDFGRYEADGKIAFLGRKDDQVKLRGYRIEPGEIEAVLDEHESVIQSVVVMEEDDMAEKRLVAYAVCDGERAPSVYELRSYLKEKLPEHMVPAWFVWLEQMPLTPNGKVDRKALPVLKEGRIERQTAYIPPRDRFELQIVQIWEQVLGIQPIGVTDNFFELGGHSLLAISLMAKIRNTLKQDLPLSALFQGATVEKLGAMLRCDASSRSWSCLVELRASGSKPPLFFAHPGGGGVLCYFDLARCLGSDQPFYGFQAPGFYGEQPSHTRLEDMAALYIEAMMTVQPEGPYLLGGWSLGGVIAYEMAQQLVAQSQSVGQLLLLDAGPGGPGEEDIGEHEDHLEHEEPARMDDALMLVRFFQGDLPLSEEDLKPFEGDERIDYVLKKAISMNLVPPGIEVAQAHSVLKMARANEKAMYNYKAQAYKGAVTLFKTAGKASMPHSIGPEFNEEMMKRIQDPTMGWGELAAGGVRVIDVPGDHGTMVRKPYVETLAVRIKECLNGAETLGS